MNHEAIRSTPAFRAQCTLPPQSISQTLFSIFPRVWFQDYVAMVMPFFFVAKIIMDDFFFPTLVELYILHSQCEMIPRFPVCIFNSRFLIQEMDRFQQIRYLWNLESHTCTISIAFSDFYEGGTITACL